MLDRLERRFGRFAIRGLLTQLVIVQGLFFAYALFLDSWSIFFHMTLEPIRILQGEYWRVVSWIFIPPQPYPSSFAVLTNFFALYLLWMYGSALEERWGSFRLNVYLISGFLFTFVGSWVAPYALHSNYIPLLSVLFAFAVYFPDFELRLFFVIPVKIKWIAYFTGALLLLSALRSPWPQIPMIFFGLSNFFIFAGPAVYRRLKNKARKRNYERSTDMSGFEVSCSECGKTQKTHPELDFRFCSRCEGAHSFCPEHLLSHEHRENKASRQSSL